LSLRALWADGAILINNTNQPKNTAQAATRPSGLLSDRQRQIMVLLSQGKTNKEIAFTLGITEGTVKQHLFTLFKKIGVTSRTKAVLKAEALLQTAPDEMDAGTDARISHDLPEDYAWRMVTAVALVPQSVQATTPSQAAKIDQGLQSLRLEANSLIKVFDGQMIAGPGGVILAGFGAPRSHLDDASRAAYLAQKISLWLLNQPDLAVGIGIATAATIVGFGNEPLYRSDAFDLATQLAKEAQPGQILATALAAKMAGPLFPVANDKPDQDDNERSVLEISSNAVVDMQAIAKRVNVPFINELFGAVRKGQTQWLSVQGWPPSACLELIDSVSAYCESSHFHTYRLRIATDGNPEQVGENIFQQLKLIARLRERAQGNEQFLNIKTNIMSAVTAMKVLCMRGPTAILIYGVNTLEVITRSFGEKGLAAISGLPLIVVATANPSDAKPNVTAKLLGNDPLASENIGTYKITNSTSPSVPDMVNTDLITMLDMLTPTARQAAKHFAQSAQSAVVLGDDKTKQSAHQELLSCGLFKLENGNVTIRDMATKQALARFFDQTA
jgi:DNA-binding CsgD family transcriptional regulator